jgi:hypothetical protein
LILSRSSDAEEKTHRLVAFSFDDDALAGMHSALDLDFDALLVRDRTLAFAFLAPIRARPGSGQSGQFSPCSKKGALSKGGKNSRVLIADFESGTSTRRAPGRSPLDVRSHLPHVVRLALAVTPHARFRLPTRFRARAGTGRASAGAFDEERLVCAGVEFFERDREFDLGRSGLRLAALARASSSSSSCAGTWTPEPTSSTTTPKQVCEKVCASAKEVVVVVICSSSSSSCSTALLAPLVIVGSLVRVAEDLPGMLDLLELCRVGGSAVWRRGLLVGMVLQREFAVRFTSGGGSAHGPSRGCRWGRAYPS